MASEALDPNSPAYDPIFAERVARARANPEPAFFGAFEPGGVFNTRGTALARPETPAPTMDELWQPSGAPLRGGAPQDTTAPIDLPPAAEAPSPLNALPPIPRVSQGDGITKITTGPLETYSIPGGSVSVDRSRGLSGQAWLDSVRGNPEHSWNAATRGWVDPNTDRIIKSNQEPTSFDEAVASLPQRGDAAPSGTFEPGGPGRTLFSAGGTLGQLLGDIQAQNLLGTREAASGGRALADLGRQAQASTFEELIRDPFAQERLKGELEAQRVALPEMLKARMEKASEAERRDFYMKGAESIRRLFREHYAKALAAKDENAMSKAEDDRDQALSDLAAAVGLGTRLSSNALYRGSGG